MAVGVRFGQLGNPAGKSGVALAVLGREPLRYPLTPDRAWRGIVTTPINKFTGIYGLSTDGI